MKRYGIFCTALIAVLLTVAMPAYAVKTVDMPENFGSDEWVAGHWEEAVGYLKYMAKDDVRGEFLNLPAMDRMEAWDAFWMGQGPNDKSMMQERRRKFFERIRYANDNFATILQPGWLTEMGETWIRLGKPDIREKYPMRAGGREIEVWNYMNPRDLYLVFLDRSGVGDFELLNYSDMIDEVYLY
jgi:GWxTD domain-containing protein